MRSLSLRVVALCAAPLLCLSGCGSSGTTPVPGKEAKGALPSDSPKGEPAVAGYALGYQFGSGITASGLTLPQERILQGVKDALEEAQPKVDEQKASMAMRSLQGKAQAAAAAKRGAAAGKNLAASQAFLAENETREGVKVTESGLQYEVLQAAEGASPSSTDTVRVHYRGTLVSGEEFDSSYSRGEPTRFPLNRVIPGWTEGLQLMTEGSKFRFFIPPELAYGNENAPEAIGPNQALIFDVELLAVE